MKLIFLAFFVLFLGQSVAQPCLPQGITFSTQAQVDSFPIAYPNCTDIQGIVYITGNEITNLNGLSSILSVATDLYIRNTSSLTNLSGLNNLTRVGNELSIGANSSLNSLVGLDGLEFIGSSFELDVNPSLNTLNGLNSLAYITGYLMITDNPSLLSLSGLDSLHFVGGDINIARNLLLNDLSGLNNLYSTGGGLTLYQNYSLSSVAGLSNLSIIGGNLVIAQNPDLSCLQGLAELTSIGGNLYIQENQLLHSLAGLDNIDPSSIINLSISENDSLSTCEVASVCSYLTSPNGTVFVQNNAVGCNNEMEIQTACQSISIPENDFSNDFLIFPNPANQTISFPSDINEKTSEVNFYRENGLRQFTIHPESDSIDISILPDGIYLVEFVFNKSTLRRRLIINRY